ncbi:hypothetical protein pipiens_014361, partial [Culex pipiens pipiens]
CANGKNFSLQAATGVHRIAGITESVNKASGIFGFPWYRDLGPPASKPENHLAVLVELRNASYGLEASMV